MTTTPAPTGSAAAAVTARPSLLRRSAIAWPDPWRPADRLLAQWVLAHGGSEALARWAGALGAAEGEGHAALALDDGARFGVDPSTRDALDAPGWVGDGTTMTPFVREGDARLFLWRYWRAEQAVADAVATLAATPPTIGPPGDAAAEEAPGAAAVDTLFGTGDDRRDAAQREAVRRCGEARLFVLTGGPGTGKTTTVLRMLLARQRRLGRPLRVAVAAPTGKAAQRLVDALRAGLADLASALARVDNHDRWADVLDAFAMPAASTVHRLLGYHPTRHRYTRDARQPIDAELVVIDEASMLDLEAFAALLDALPAQAALWLVGDADQLSPVGPGSALQDLVQALDRQPGAPMQRLVHSFRAESHLVALNQALRNGDAMATRAALRADAAIQHAPLADEHALEAALRAWALALAGEAHTAPLPAGSDAAREAAARALRSLTSRQWLCATREGPRGSVAVNARLDALLRRRLDRSAHHPRDTGGIDSPYAGQRLLITRNDIGNGLFNGDVGLCLADADGRLRVWFDGSDGPHALPPGALPAHEPAWALTVHKSQGSEYAQVAVLLPSDPMHRVLSRELLYTAASRAKRALTLHGDDAVIDACLAMPVRRSGGLHARLGEALAVASPAC